MKNTHLFSVLILIFFHFVQVSTSHAQEVLTNDTNETYRFHWISDSASAALSTQKKITITKENQSYRIHGSNTDWTAQSICVAKIDNNSLLVIMYGGNTWDNLWWGAVQLNLNTGEISTDYVWKDFRGEISKILISDNQTLEFKWIESGKIIYWTVKKERGKTTLDKHE